MILYIRMEMRIDIANNGNNNGTTESNEAHVTWPK